MMKVGLDDAFARGFTVLDIISRCVRSDLGPAPKKDDDGITAQAGIYAVLNGALSLLKRRDNAEYYDPLTNFDARITEDLVMDNGLDKRGELVIEGQLANGRRLGQARVPRDRFAAMNWVTDGFGVQAIINAGMGMKDHARVAIQSLSSDTVQRVVYEHSGWRQVGDHGWTYLHTSGGISANGLIGEDHGLVVNLPRSCNRIDFPTVPAEDELANAVRSALQLCDVGTSELFALVLGAVFRAPLAQVARIENSVMLAGETGVGKTVVSQLAMAFFGAAFASGEAPANWTSTANALEKTLFDFKDALVLVDDFKPTGSSNDIQRQHKDADRVLRGVGNSAGRGRLNADLTTRASYTPRGFVLSTGEDIPSGQSLRARFITKELIKGDVRFGPALQRAQDNAAGGEYARAMAGYLHWLAPQIDDLSERSGGMLRELRGQVINSGLTGHNRTPDALASMLFGWRVFLAFAVDAKAIDLDAANDLWERAWNALLRLGGLQSDIQDNEEPARRFLTVVASALTSGEAHLTGLENEMPADPSAWGWQEITSDSIDWRPRGPRIGWINGDSIYLNGEAAYKIGSRDNGIGLNQQTLYKRLHERGFLVSTDPHRTNTKIQVSSGVVGSERKRVRVYHVSARALLGDEEAGQSGQSGHGEQIVPENQGSAPLFCPAFDVRSQESGQKSGAGNRESGTNSTETMPSAPSAPKAPLLQTQSSDTETRYTHGQSDNVNPSDDYCDTDRNGVCSQSKKCCWPGSCTLKKARRDAA